MRCWAAISISSSVGRDRLRRVRIVDARDRGGRLQHVQRRARVARADIATRCSRASSGSVTRRRSPRSAASARSTIEPSCSSVSGSRRKTRMPREQRRVDLEVGVLRGRADQRDRAVLDLRQQRVLLRLVEAVDLVEEEHRRPAAPVDPLARAGDHGAHVGDAAHHRAEASRTARQRRRRAAGPAWSCRFRAVPTAPSTRGGRARSCAAARRARRPGAPGRRTPRASAAACARRAARARPCPTGPAAVGRWWRPA